MVDAALRECLLQIVGASGLVSDAARLARYNTPPWQGAEGGARLVLRPANSAQVAACVHQCARQRIAMVPFGGGTGFLGGQLAAADGSQVVISLERMTAVRAMDPTSRSIVVEAGMTVARVREQAWRHGLTFPLSFAADGSANVGGALATNAGGMNALRYGVARDLCLGLEVVLPSGQILDQLGTVRKDNTGYDLKQLFIGSEGTLGIITAASLKLYPKATASACALVAVPNAQAAVELLGKLSCRSDQRICLFEFMMADALNLVQELVPGCRCPIAHAPAAVVLVELEGSNGAELDTLLEATLQDGVDCGIVLDVTLAKSQALRDRLLGLREALPEAVGRAGWVASHDICLPISRVHDYLVALTAELAALSSRHRAIVYGHLGDGNLHVNIVRTDPMAPAGAALVAAFSDAILAPALAVGGSVSAEHGIGAENVGLLARTETAPALALMHAIKNLLDPLGIMNPGKVLDARPAPAG